jgi:NAD(P)-dependent dehydrogenase (short-subunit alcohol dehydrogenase family)
VRALAQTASGVDVLVNNAGIISAEQRLSEDGYELTFQVNPSSASCSRC